jgi:surface carbohydrate biosynthesis protein
MFLFHRRIFLKSPPRSDIVIFDEENSYPISMYILEDRPYFIFNVRPEKIYISPSIIINYFISLKYFRIHTKTKSRKSKALLALLQLRHCYHFACLMTIKPKIVITFIDNSTDFHWLSRYYKNASFFAIQNGIRTNNELNSLKNKKFYLQHYFCFGNYEESQFNKHELLVKNFYPIGSLLSGYYQFNKNNNIKFRYDICILSAWYHAEENPTSKVEKTRKYSKDLMNRYLAKYISEYKLNAVILLKRTKAEENLADTNGKSKEIEYIEKYFGKNIDMIKNNSREMSTYKAMDISKIVVGFASTTLREAFSWGKKILYCDFTGSNLFSDYDPMILFTRRNYELFKVRLNELRNEPHEDYIGRTKAYANYLMNNDPNYPPHIYIRKKIEEYL